jgi:hypothetical protein
LPSRCPLLASALAAMPLNMVARKTARVKPPMARKATLGLTCRRRAELAC